VAELEQRGENKQASLYRAIEEQGDAENKPAMLWSSTRRYEQQPL